MINSKKVQNLIIFAIVTAIYFGHGNIAAHAKPTPSTPTHLTQKEIEILAEANRKKVETTRQLQKLKKEKQTLEKRLGVEKLANNVNYLKTVLRSNQKEKVLKRQRERLDTLRQQYGVSDEFQNWLDEINEEADTWIANYNPISIKPESELQNLTGLKPPKNNKEESKAETRPPESLQLPARFSWKDEGIMTPVKNQGGCGACWAFSAIASLEALIKRSHGVTTDLSEQQILSCCSGSCAGGWPDNALSYIQSTGVTSENCFYYRGYEVSCDNLGNDCPGNSWQNNAWKIGSYSSCGLTEQGIKSAIFNSGPVIVAMFAYNDFRFYNGGIYSHPGQEPPGAANHAVILLGWGSQGTTNYWIGKNSWGPGWGEGGYFRIEMGDCNIDSIYCGYPKNPQAPDGTTPPPQTPTTPPTNTPTIPPSGVSPKQILKNWGNASWDPDYDRNEDNLINGLDFGLVVKN